MGEIMSSMNEYFATLPTSEAGHQVMARVTEYYTFARTSGYYTRMYRSWRSYYGLNLRENGARSDQVSFAGEQGELTMMKVNHYRNIAQHLLTLTTAQRPAPQPVSTNTDNKSHAQTTLASGLLDYYSREKRVERVLRLAAEHAIVFSEGFIKCEWDFNAGEEYARQSVMDADGTQRVQSVREGDLKFTNLTPLDVIKDPHVDNYSDLNWLVTRTFVNKYELAARFPTMRDNILSRPPAQYDAMRFMLKPYLNSTDSVAVYELWHRKTAAVPEGRYMVLCDADCIMFDGDLPYPNVPIRRIAPGEFVGSPSGYTPMFDLLAIQESVDAL